MKAFRCGATPELVATIPVGNLPHGIWPSGDGSRVYVALENGEQAVAIDTLSNQVIATIPIGQTTQALVYVPNAVPNGDGAQNVSPLGEAANTARLHLQPEGNALPDGQASVAVNSLGLLDLVQIAAEGLTPKSQYQVCLAESDDAPFGKLESRRGRNRAGERSAKDHRSGCRIAADLAWYPVLPGSDRPPTIFEGCSRSFAFA